MKNIGILTFFRPINVGAVLQSCAMSMIVLEKMGYKAELIDYRLERIEISRKPLSMKKLAAYKGTRRKIERAIIDLVRCPLRVVQQSYFNKFIKSQLRVSEKTYYQLSELVQSCQDYDAYIVGSDLVWSPEMAEGVNPVYFLKFVANTKKPKLSYAASIGTTALSDEELLQYKELLANLDSISVREHSTAIQLQALSKKKIYTVLDPTLLTECDDWNDFYTSDPIINQKYVFAFMLENSPILIKAVNEIAKEHDLIIVTSGRKHLGYRAKKVINLGRRFGPSEFLNVIKNASFVITNSYHGCAFSIIFHKDFYCVPHTTRGVRMTDLMRNLKLDRRIITDNNIPEKTSINYEMIEMLRKQMIDDSMAYLAQALGREGK